MAFKKSLRPSFVKVFQASLLTYFWYLIVGQLLYSCLYECFVDPTKFSKYMLVSDSCSCQPTMLSDVITQYLILVITPFVVFYVLGAFFSYIKHKMGIKEIMSKRTLALVIIISAIAAFLIFVTVLTFAF